MRMAWLAVVPMLPARPDQPLPTLAQKQSELVRTKVKIKLIIIHTGPELGFKKSKFT